MTESPTRPSSEASTEVVLALAFEQIADTVYAGEGYPAVYDAVVQAAARVVDGCDHASVMVRRANHFETVATSDEVAATVDRYERELREGPCVEALTDEPVYHEPDLTVAPRWPRLAERVLESTDVRAMAGFRLRLGAGHRASLNLFGDRVAGLDLASVEQGIVLASFVSVALTAAQGQETADSLRAGLQSNREIGKAVGLMMAFHKIDDAAAFAMLRRTSQDLNVKLLEVARQVVEHHNRV